MIYAKSSRRDRLTCSWMAASSLVLMAGCQNLGPSDDRTAQIPNPPSYLTEAAIPCRPEVKCAGQTWPEVAEQRAEVIGQQNIKIRAVRRDWAAMKKKLEKPLR